jgi:hypothetical protein
MALIRISCKNLACQCLHCRARILRRAARQGFRNSSFAAVISSTRNPVYAKQKLSPPRLRAVVFLCLLLAIVFLCTPAPSRADSLEDGARGLAGRTAGLVRNLAVAYESRNLARLQEAEFLAFSSAFQEELQKRGVNIVGREEAASVLLTLSENVNGYVAVVRVQRGENLVVLMGSLTGNAKSGRGQTGTTMGLQRELMFSQEEPLLDADVNRYKPKLLYALGKQQISIYEWKETEWEIVNSTVLPRKKNPSRDLWAVVGYSVDATAAVFPGEACRVGMQPWHCEPETYHLRPSSVDWQLVEKKKLPAWLSAAQFEINGQDALVITGADGLARVYSQEPEAIATIPGWGSEIASTHSGCGRGWQILVTGKGDWTTPDSVMGMEIEGEKVMKVTESIDLPGPVIALHQTASDKELHRDMAITVVHNLHTGFYEVYRLTITCSN